MITFTANLHDTFVMRDGTYRIKDFLVVPFPHEELEVTVDGVVTDEWSYNTESTIRLDYSFDKDKLPSQIVIQPV